MVVGADNKVAYRQVAARRHRRRAAHRHRRAQARRAHRRQRPAARPPGRHGRAADRADDRAATAIAAQLRLDRIRAMNISRFFIDRPVFAGVLSVLIFVVRPAGAACAADLGISGGRAAAGRRPRQLSRRQPEGDRRDGGDADRGADQRRRGHALHGQPGDHRRADDADRHLQARHRPRQGAAAGAEPRRARPSRACRTRCARWASPRSRARPT